MKKLETHLVQPTITPRFAISCSQELLEQLGDVARAHNLHIQVKIRKFPNMKISFSKTICRPTLVKAWQKLIL